MCVFRENTEDIYAGIEWEAGTPEAVSYTHLDVYKRQGMDWMYANCSTTAQRGALDWMGPFHDAIKPVVEKDVYKRQVR